MPNDPARPRRRGKGRNVTGALGALLIVVILFAMFLFTRSDRLDTIFATESPATVSANPAETNVD
jgi:hypothetical protein